MLAWFFRSATLSLCSLALFFSAPLALAIGLFVSPFAAQADSVVPSDKTKGSAPKSLIYISNLNDPIVSDAFGPEVIASTIQLFEDLINEADETPMELWCAGDSCIVTEDENSQEIIVKLPSGEKISVRKRRNSRNSTIKIEGLIVPLNFHLQCDGDGNCVISHDFLGFAIGEICRMTVQPDNHLKVTCDYFDQVKIDCEFWQEPFPSEADPTLIRFCRRCEELTLPEAVPPVQLTACSDAVNPETLRSPDAKDPMRIFPDFLPFLPTIFPALFPR